MAEKKTTKAAATEKAAAPKKATAKKATTAKTAAPKATKAAKASVIYVTSENAGFRAGDIYQALAAANAPLSVEDLAKQANVANEDIYLGLGWLLKEGKITSTEDNKVILA